MVNGHGLMGNADHLSPDIHTISVTITISITIKKVIMVRMVVSRKREPAKWMVYYTVYYYKWFTLDDVGESIVLRNTHTNW